VVQRVTIAFEGEDLELVEQACRELAERARRDAEAVKGTSVEPVHKSAEARFLGMAERLKVARG
jgi:ribosomal protein S10